MKESAPAGPSDTLIGEVCDFATAAAVAEFARRLKQATHLPVTSTRSEREFQQWLKTTAGNDLIRLITETGQYVGEIMGREPREWTPAERKTAYEVMIVVLQARLKQARRGRGRPRRAGAGIIARARGMKPTRHRSDRRLLRAKEKRLFAIFVLGIKAALWAKDESEPADWAHVRGMLSSTERNALLGIKDARAIREYLRIKGIDAPRGGRVERAYRTEFSRQMKANPKPFGIF